MKVLFLLASMMTWLALCPLTTFTTTTSEVEIVEDDPTANFKEVVLEDGLYTVSIPEDWFARYDEFDSSLVISNSESAINSMIDGGPAFVTDDGGVGMFFSVFYPKDDMVDYLEVDRESPTFLEDFAEAYSQILSGGDERRLVRDAGVTSIELHGDIVDVVFISVEYPDDNAEGIFWVLGIDQDTEFLVYTSSFATTGEMEQYEPIFRAILSTFEFDESRVLEQWEN